MLDVDGLARLLDLLRADGFELVGPTVRDGAVVHARIEGVADLPRGTGDEQAPGSYRLVDRGDQQLFGWGSPAQSFKRELFPPRVEVVRIRRTRAGFEVGDPRPPARRLALVGVRPCELAAIGVQDRVLVEGRFADADYADRRRAIFIFAVHCGAPSGTCFCSSMGTGPRARGGFDLAATELAAGDGDVHRFVLEAGSDEGERLLARIEAPAASPADLAAADAVVERAAGRMGRTLDTRDLAARLRAAPEHPRWAEVARRCLGCASCTLVCPTCFCTDLEESSDLSCETATRTRTWDSCFTTDFAYIHGGSVRPSLRARYRQWLMHKLGTWPEQFGRSGCVGCGRCIAWCPAGIDFTVEAAAIGGS